jgi:hypothetical protein
MEGHVTKSIHCILIGKKFVILCRKGLINYIINMQKLVEKFKVPFLIVGEEIGEVEWQPDHGVGAKATAWALPTRILLEDNTTLTLVADSARDHAILPEIRSRAGGASGATASPVPTL